MFTEFKVARLHIYMFCWVMLFVLRYANVQLLNNPFSHFSLLLNNLLSITWANFIDQLDWRGTNKDISLITVGFLIYPLREAFIYQWGTIGLCFLQKWSSLKASMNLTTRFRRTNAFYRLRMIWMVLVASKMN